MPITEPRRETTPMDATTVQRAAERLEAAGQPVSVRAVRQQLGGGSLRDISRHLRTLVTVPRHTGAAMVTATMVTGDAPMPPTATAPEAPAIVTPPAPATGLRAPAS